MLKRFLSLPFILCAISGFAQTNNSYDPLQAPNSFQSANNPNYWKNKLPDGAYWQQDVHYSIKANVDETTDIIDGTETLVYTNNSPDTLTFVYFHLYQQAFQPGSYLDNLQFQNNVIAEWGKYERDGLGTKVSSVKIDGQDVQVTYDNTIMRIDLPTPLLPNKAATFELAFKTYFDGGGDVERRMKTFDAWGNKHYDGVHWYPRISVYDRKFGWTTDQHLGKEFYGDFGCFDVELTFASNFVIEATGFLVNRDEALPESLRKKLDIKNFAQKPWNSEPSIIIPYKLDEHKTWIYHAENVHDFAFTADPTYRIGEAEWNGIKCYAVVQEPHAAGWQNAAEYTAKIIKTFSEDIGMYTYHKMVVADARDGMEYPMLTLDGGWDPQYRSLLVHEVGHNWFFGQVGTNETYRAFMDEGFTQFLTTWGMMKIDGDTVVTRRYGKKQKYLKKYTKPELAIDSEVYNGYMWAAIPGKDPQLNTHSDGFGGALQHGGGYGQVYNKTAVMLYNLQYVLGDDLFLDAMKHYFEQWKIAHPYPNDFRNSFIQYTKVDLNWFFDQWLETNKSIDYAIKKVRKGDGENAFEITFERKGRMQMPLDFTVIARDGKEHHFLIPNTVFEKETEATILPKWLGWDKLYPTYTAKVTIPEGIKNVLIDPSNRLADVYMLNNSKKLQVEYDLDHHIYNPANWKKYNINSRPEFWWNGYDGVKAGMHMNGHYRHYKHIFDVTGWFNTGLGQNLHPQFVNDDAVNNDFDNFSYRVNYKTALDKLGQGFNIKLHASSMAGLNTYQGGFEKAARNGKTSLYFHFKSMIRPDSADLAYLLYPEEWDVNRYNNTANLGLDHKYEYVRGNGEINVHLRSSSLGSDYEYSQMSATVKNSTKLGKLRFNSRVFAQYGTGSSTPDESALFLAGANPEQMMDSKYTRSTGFFDHAFFGYGKSTDHFHAGGGLNLRGYSGYSATFVDDNDSVRFVHKGHSGAAVNMELELQNLIGKAFGRLGRLFNLKYYLFADAGIINANLPQEDLFFADFRADAGIGAALTVRHWGYLNDIKPLTIRFDMPFVLNRVPFAENNYVLPRWIIAVNRAF
jgi:hypothetical protein